MRQCRFLRGDARYHRVQDAPVAAVPTVVDVTCFGGGDGSISLWPPEGRIRTVSTVARLFAGVLFNNLHCSAYDVRVRDAHEQLQGDLRRTCGGPHSLWPAGTDPGLYLSAIGRDHRGQRNADHRWIGRLPIQYKRWGLDGFYHGRYGFHGPYGRHLYHTGKGRQQYRVCDYLARCNHCAVA